MSKEKYQPTPEEMKKAEEMMSEEEKGGSEKREAILKSFKHFDSLPQWSIGEEYDESGKIFKRKAFYQGVEEIDEEPFELLGEGKSGVIKTSMGEVKYREEWHFIIGPYDPSYFYEKGKKDLDKESEDLNLEYKLQEYKISFFYPVRYNMYYGQKYPHPNDLSHYLYPVGTVIDIDKYEDKGEGLELKVPEGTVEPGKMMMWDFFVSTSYSDRLRDLFEKNLKKRGKSFNDLRKSGVGVGRQIPEGESRLDGLAEIIGGLSDDEKVELFELEIQKNRQPEWDY